MLPLPALRICKPLCSSQTAPASPDAGTSQCKPQALSTSHPPARASCSVRHRSPQRCSRRACCPPERAVHPLSAQGRAREGRPERQQQTGRPESRAEANTAGVCCSRPVTCTPSPSQTPSRRRAAGHRPWGTENSGVRRGRAPERQLPKAGGRRAVSAGLFIFCFISLCLSPWTISFSQTSGHLASVFLSTQLPLRAVQS